jgi:2-polyprenyl-3-methyl-5-hydroxy-6-metoxy-1,4-benzoquinol methylase
MNGAADAIKRARELFREGRAREAKPLALLAVRTGRPTPSWHVTVAKIAAALGEVPEALASIEKATSEDPQPEWLMVQSNLYRRAGDISAALDFAEKAVAASSEPSAKWKAIVSDLRARKCLPQPNTREATAEFYDAVYADSADYARDAELASYAPIWDAIAALIKSYGSTQVLDIGCGPGQFAEFLMRRLPGIRYSGLDFSEVAICAARERCPSLRFEVADALRSDAASTFEYDLATCTEVLEHIDDDIGLLRRLRSGARFIGSVPNFDSFGHVRFFASEDEVAERYTRSFSTLEIATVPLRQRSRLFLLDGVIA